MSNSQEHSEGAAKCVDASLSPVRELNTCCPGGFKKKKKTLIFQVVCDATKEQGLLLSFLPFSWTWSPHGAKLKPKLLDLGGRHEKDELLKEEVPQPGTTELQVGDTV